MDVSKRIQNTQVLLRVRNSIVKRVRMGAQAEGNHHFEHLWRWRQHGIFVMNSLKRF